MSKVTVIYRPHPFRDEAYEAVAPAGLTLDEIAGGAAPQLRAWVDGQPVERDEWRNTILAPGSLIEIRAIPGAPVVPALISFAGAAASAAIGGGIVGTLVGGLVTAGLGLASNRLFPPPQQSDPPSQAFIRRPGIVNAQNVLEPWGYVTEVFGTRRVSPCQIARPFTRVIDHKQHLTMLMGLVGEYDLRDFRFGNTPASELGAQVEVFTGNRGDLYSDEITSASMSVPLNQEGLHQVVTVPRDDTRQITLEFTLPNGIYAINRSDRNRGRIEAAAVIFYIENRKVHGPHWGDVNRAGGIRLSAPFVFRGGSPLPGGLHPLPHNVFAVAGKLRRMVRASITFDVPPGKHEIRVTRGTTPVATGAVGGGQLFLTGVISAGSRRRTPINMPGVTKIAVRVPESHKLGRVAQSFNVLATRRLRVWEGARWSRRAHPTRLAAHAYAWILAGPNNPSNAHPIPINRLDRNTLEEWARADSRARWYFDAILQGQESLWNLMRDIAGSVGAAWVNNDGSYSVIREEPNRTPVQLITPRNSGSDWRAQLPMAPSPSMLRVRFPSRSHNYEWREIIVRAPSRGRDRGSRVEVLELPYTVEWRQARALARRHLLALRKRRELITVPMDWESLVCSRGDIVLMRLPDRSDDVLSGRITGLIPADWVRQFVKHGGCCLSSMHNVPDKVLTTENGIALMPITRDPSRSLGGFYGDVDDIEFGGNWWATVRRSDSLIVQARLRPKDGPGFKFLEDRRPDLKPGDLYTVSNETLTRWRVVAIEPRDNLTANVIVTPEAPEIIQW